VVARLREFLVVREVTEREDGVSFAYVLAKPRKWTWSPARRPSGGRRLGLGAVAVGGRFVRAGRLARGRYGAANATIQHALKALKDGGSSRRPRKAKKAKRGRTKTPAGTRQVQLPPSVAVLYEELLDSHQHPFVFCTPEGGLWRRSNFRQRYWRPAWDGHNPANP
jgi:hypothetical protein